MPPTTGLRVEKNFDQLLRDHTHEFALLTKETLVQNATYDRVRRALLHGYQTQASMCVTKACMYIHVRQLHKS